MIDHRKAAVHFSPQALTVMWVHWCAYTIPLTYEVDALRSLMVICGATTCGVSVDPVVVLATTALFVIAAAKLYPWI